MNKKAVFLIIVILASITMACGTLFPRVAVIYVKNQGKILINSIAVENNTPSETTTTYQLLLNNAFFKGNDVSTEQQNIPYGNDWFKYNVFWFGEETLSLTFSADVINKTDSTDSLGNQIITVFDIKQNEIIYLTITDFKVSSDQTTLEIGTEVVRR